jgi:1,4-dihydroxy-2-naphthoyl-CoA hydrolase
MIMSETIWHNKNLRIEDLNQPRESGLAGHVGIAFTRLGPDFLEGTMPVDHRTKQPAGLLHGGASVVLAETLGSIGAYLTVDTNHHDVVGLEVNANHIRSARSGHVTGIAKPLHRGRSTQVWEIRITDQEDKLVCISRLTVAITTKK